MEEHERKTIQELFALATGIVDRLTEDVLADQSLRRTPVAYARIAERAADKARQLHSLCDAILVIAASDTTELAGLGRGKHRRAKKLTPQLFFPLDFGRERSVAVLTR